MLGSRLSQNVSSCCEGQTSSASPGRTLNPPSHPATQFHPDHRSRTKFEPDEDSACLEAEPPAVSPPAAVPAPHARASGRLATAHRRASREWTTASPPARTVLRQLKLFERVDRHNMTTHCPAARFDASCPCANRQLISSAAESRPLQPATNMCTLPIASLLLVSTRLKDVGDDYIATA